MEEQVLSIEQMQELIDMGINVSNASMLWYPKMAIDARTGKGYVDSHYLTINHINSEHFWSTRIGKETIPTFTLQDILTYIEKIEPILTKDNGSALWFMEVTNLERDSLMYCEGCESDSPLKTAFKALKWCKQNNFI